MATGSSYPTGTKIIIFVSPAYRCYMRNLVRIGFMASDGMSFENVDGRRMPASGSGELTNKTRDLTHFAI